MNTQSVGRLGRALLAIGGLLAHAITATLPATAAQPWYCICKGETKRFLASTRHCEKQMHLPKGQWCTATQVRQVYAPACRKIGCKIKPL